jgi:hypothetical protein
MTTAADAARPGTQHEIFCLTHQWKVQSWGASGRARGVLSARGNLPDAPAPAATFGTKNKQLMDVQAWPTATPTATASRECSRPN